MITLTKLQRQAVKRVWQRIVDAEKPSGRGPQTTYRTLRRKVQPGPDCIMLLFAGMWLGIEKDGYTHS